MTTIMMFICLLVISWCLFIIFVEGEKRKLALFFALIGMYFMGVLVGYEMILTNCVRAIFDILLLGGLAV